MKKGLAYVDWAISVGMFIVLVSLIFIIFHPLIFQQEYGEDYLIKIVEDGLYEHSFIELERYPIFVVSASQLIAASIGREPILQDINITNSFLTNQAHERLEITLTPDEVRFQGEGSSAYGQNYIFYIFHSPDLVVTNTPTSGEILPIEYAVGVHEERYGYYDTFFNDLKNQDIKDIINYPEDREFDIGIYYDSSLTEEVNSYSYTEPSESDTVYTLIYSVDGIFIDDASITMTPVFIRIRTW